jgi:hypothetical protein
MKISHPKYEVGSIVYLINRNGNYIRIKSTTVESFECHFTFKVGPNSPDQESELNLIEYRLKNFDGRFEDKHLFPTMSEAYNSVIKESVGETKRSFGNL